MSDKPELTINPAFQSLLPPLSADERQTLRESLVADGCRDPIVTWNGVILDGHNRYALCQELGLPFDVTWVELPDEEAAMDWIDRNQLARRNLTPDDFKLAVGRRYNRKKKPHGGQIPGSRDQIDPSIERTAETIAKEYGVSAPTVKRAGKLAEEVERIEEEEPELDREEVIQQAKENIKPNKPHVAHNNGDNEWYTPAAYIEAARNVLGCIDLDPASSIEANAVVGAARFFSQEEDGLRQVWTGTVWMNPPYAGELIGKFIDKLADSVESRSVKEAIVLVNNATETKWFARLAGLSSYLCFPLGRVKFWHPRKESLPLQGQVVAYIGDCGGSFGEFFKGFGIIAYIEKP